MPPIDPVEKNNQVSGAPSQEPSDETTSKPAEDKSGTAGSEGSGTKEETPSVSGIPQDHKFDKQQVTLLEPNVPDIKSAPLPDDLADFQLVKKLSDQDLESIVNKYSVRRGVRIDHDHAGERAYEDAIVFETSLKDRFNEDHLESGVTTRSYSTGREAEMACQGYSSLKGSVKAEMAKFSASTSDSEGSATAQKTTETFTVSSHSYYRARLSFNPLSGHARLTRRCEKASLDVCSMHKAAGASITETRKALQRVHDNFGAVLPRTVLFGGLLTITSSSNTTSQSLTDAAEKQSAAAANAVLDKKSGAEFDASAQNASAKTGTGKYVVGDVNYSIRSLGGDPIKTTNVWAWTHTISAPEHWAVVRVDDFIALHEMLSSENSLTIQEIMKAEPPVRKPLKGKWVDTTVVASSRSSGNPKSFQAYAVDPKHLVDGWCFVGQQYTNHQALLLKVTDEAVDRKLRRITHFTTMWNNHGNSNDSPNALSSFRLETAELHTDGYEALSSQFIAPQDGCKTKATQPTLLDALTFSGSIKMTKFALEPWGQYVEPIDVYAVPREYLIQATLINDVNGAIFTDAGTGASGQCSVWPVVAERATKDDVVDMHFFKAVQGRSAANNTDKVYMLKRSCIDIEGESA